MQLEKDPDSPLRRSCLSLQIGQLCFGTCLPSRRIAVNGQLQCTNQWGATYNKAHLNPCPLSSARPSFCQKRTPPNQRQSTQCEKAPDAVEPVVRPHFSDCAQPAESTPDINLSTVRIAPLSRAQPLIRTVRILARLRNHLQPHPALHTPPVVLHPGLQARTRRARCCISQLCRVLQEPRASPSAWRQTSSLTRPFLILGVAGAHAQARASKSLSPPSRSLLACDITACENTRYIIQSCPLLIGLAILILSCLLTV